MIGDALVLCMIKVVNSIWTSWWRHQMETFFALLALCEEKPPVTGEFPSQRPVTWILMFSLICTWIHGWANHQGAIDFRHQYAHYDITVMISRDITMTSHECHAIPDHQPLNSLLKILFSLRSKKPYKVCYTSLLPLREIHQWQLDSPHEGQVIWKAFPCHDIIMI